MGWTSDRGGAADVAVAALAGEGPARSTRAPLDQLLAPALLALLTLAGYLALRGVPAPLEALLLVGVIGVPLAGAGLLRRAGGPHAPVVLAAGAIVLVTALVALGGGLGSPLALAFAPLPLVCLAARGVRGALLLGGAAFAAPAALLVVAGPSTLGAAAVAIVACAAAAWLIGVAVVRERARLGRARDEALAAAEDAAQARASLLATLGHELRTPLAGMIGTLDLLAGASLEPPDRRHLELARASAASLRVLLGDLLALAKSGASELTIAPRECLPGQVVREAVSLFVGAADARGLGFGVEVDPACDEPAMVDDLRLRQILGNLASNAVKFTRSGRISVEASVIAGAPRRLRVAVRDTGVGIPRELQRRLFQPFVRGRLDGVSGSGLGLAISRGLASAMGGEITLISAPGEGATFTLTIPLGDPAAAAEARTGEALGSAERASVAVAAAPGAALEVLVADDTPVILAVVEAILAEAGHHVVAVSGGAEAIAAARARPFDLFLVDLHMPDIDGLEVIEAIRGLVGPASRARVVVLSASDDPALVKLATRAGADAFLRKPIDADALRRELARAGRRGGARPEAGASGPGDRREENFMTA